MPERSDRKRPRPGAAFPRGIEPPRTPGQRAGVTREAVLEVAHRVVADEGLDHVTMRRLGAALGVAPNALYTYFPNKSAILDALLDAVLAGVRAPDGDSRDWRSDLTALMRASRRALLAHPRLVPLFVARPGGTNALRLGEAVLRLLGRGGIRGQRAVEALRALLVYTLGFAAVEVPRVADPAGQDRLAQAAARIQDLPDADFPETRAVATQLARHPGDRDFEIGLAWLLAGIAQDAEP